MKQLKQILNPSLIAAVISVIIGISPPLKSLFYGSRPPLKFISDSAKTLGDRYNNIHS